MEPQKQPAYVTLRACKAWPTLAFIDHPNNPGWSIRFSETGDHSMLAMEYLDTNGECVSWDLVKPSDRRCHNNPSIGGFWDVELYLIGRYTLRPNSYSYDVARVALTEHPLMSRNVLHPTSR